MTSERDGDKVIAAVNTFKKLAEIPSVSSAEIDKSGDGIYDIRLVLSSRSYSTLGRRTQRGHLKVSKELKVISSSFSPAIDSSDDPIKAQFSSLPSSSSSPLYTAILREVNGKQGKEKKRFVELWKGERCIESADVTKHHGAFTTNDTLGSFSIHDDKVLYSAEAIPPPKEVDIGSRKTQDGEDGLADWEYVSPLGEKFGGQLKPTVFLLQFNVNSKEEAKISRLAASDLEKDPIISSALFGQAVFSSSGNDIYLTAYPTLLDGRRLGIIYCSNRPAIIFKAPVDLNAGGSIKEAEEVKKKPWIPASWKRLSTPNFSGRLPRALPSGGCIWLQAESGGAHNDCDSLMSCNEEGDAMEEIPILSVPDKKTTFAGLAASNLRRSCLLQQSKGIALDTIWGSSRSIVSHQFGSANKETKKKSDDSNWSYTLLCTDGQDTVLAVRSSPLHPQQVVIAKVSTSSDNVKWSTIYDTAFQWQDEEEYRSLDNLHFSVEETSLSQSEMSDEVLVQSIIIEKRAAKCESAMLFLHGGPHSATTTDWSPSIAAMCLAGYSIVMPNYHGSLGQGQKFVHSLLGQCGTLDVADCVACIDRLIKQDRVDANKIAVQGGSHGGFLTTHLIGQYPNMFKAAIARNPVIAAGIMEGTTDIPDWCYAEFGEPFNFDNVASLPHFLSTNQYEKLQDRSPMKYLDNIRTPLLLLLGLDDKRVPPSQSKTIYHYLKARNRDVKMLSFDDQDHALDGIECELICWEASFRLLIRCT